jgi:hypothetical protein
MAAGLAMAVVVAVGLAMVVAVGLVGLGLVLGRSSRSSCR